VAWDQPFFDPIPLPIALPWRSCSFSSQISINIAGRRRFEKLYPALFIRNGQLIADDSIDGLKVVRSLNELSIGRLIRLAKEHIGGDGSRSATDDCPPTRVQKNHRETLGNVPSSAPIIIVGMDPGIGGNSGSLMSAEMLIIAC